MYPSLYTLSIPLSSYPLHPSILLLESYTIIGESHLHLKIDDL